MKIALVEPLAVPDSVILELSAPIRAMGHEFVAYDSVSETTEELIKRSRDCDVVMIANHPFPEEAIEAADHLKMISVAFTGIDHVAVDACRNRKIMICNAAGYSNETVAELIIGMAVDALRNVVRADRAVRSGGTSAGIGGREIRGRKVGIIGLGRIGLMTAKYFQAFGAEVVAYSRSRKEEAVRSGIRYVALEELLSQCDIVSVNLPLNDETRGFLSRERIAQMKPDAVLINCARGPIVDNQALADALNGDRLGFACVDVYDMEPPLPESYPLLHAKNTLLTPHQAFISEESMVRRARIVFDNVTAWLKGEPVNVCGSYCRTGALL
jgi:phosphoglycerate dehydrogenase-like enzyme